MTRPKDKSPGWLPGFRRGLPNIFMLNRPTIVEGLIFYRRPLFIFTGLVILAHMEHQKYIKGLFLEKLT